MVNSCSVGSESALTWREEVVGFQVMYKSTIDHSFHCFAEATCERDGTIVGGDGAILASFRNSNGIGMMPRWWKRIMQPDVIENIQ